MNPKFKNDTLIFALGGLGEVGKNMYCFMHKDEIIIIDAGVMFPEDELMGIDYVIQDVSFLKKNEDKIKGLFISHGHEDHIGGIPFLLKTVNIPMIYAPRQAAELIKLKLADHNLNYKNITTYTEENIYKFRYFTVEFFRTNHSIPDSHGICLTTPDGIIVATGDFKFDMTPVGPVANFHKMAEIGSRGVSLLLSDSTNALSEGNSRSESKVDDALSDLFSIEDGRIIVATFASNIYRLKHIVETCKRNGRKIAVVGRGMDNSINIAIEGGYIKDKSIFVSLNEAKNIPNNKLCLLCTGSQGEPFAALSRIANGTHKQITLQPGDVVIFSSSPIPGNTASVSEKINQLYLKGVKVYTNTSLSDLHTSGHAFEEELKLMLRLIKPKHFMPFHGEYRMLKKHADIAIECGIPKERTFICENGDVIALSKGQVKRAGKVEAGDVYVDGNRIGDVGNIIINDRKVMSNDGIVVVISNINIDTNKLLGKVNITTRGFVLVNENEALLKKLENIASKVITNHLKKDKLNYNELKSEIINDMVPFIYKETGRKPIILPVIMEIKKGGN